MVQLQDSIMEHLHHHTFSNMFFDGIFEAHVAKILSCFGPRVGVWFIAQIVFPTIRLFSLFFSTTLHMRLGLPHPSITGIFQCMCTHLIDLMGIHLLHYVHGNERTGTHVLVCDTSTTITQDADFHVG
jgi:hypothetical protein